MCEVFHSFEFCGKATEAVRPMGTLKVMGFVMAAGSLRAHMML